MQINLIYFKTLLDSVSFVFQEHILNGNISYHLLNIYVCEKFS